MPARRNALKGAVARGRRRGRPAANNRLRIRYQAPTARVQRNQILANASLLAKHSRLLRRTKVFTDWQAGGKGTLVDATWNCFALTDFSNWTGVLRQDMAVIRTASETYLSRLQVNFRASLYAASSSVISIFVVTPRKSFATRDCLATPPQATTEFIASVNNVGYNVRLNPNVWKVHMSKYITLTANGLDNPPPPAPFSSGNPFTTYRKWQNTLTPKATIKVPFQPSGTPTTWKDVTLDMMPYYEKYYVMIYNATVQGSGQDAPTVVFDQLATCINTN